MLYLGTKPEDVMSKAQIMEKCGISPYLLRQNIKLGLSRINITYAAYDHCTKLPPIIAQRIVKHLG